MKGSYCTVWIPAKHSPTGKGGGDTLLEAWWLLNETSYLRLIDSCITQLKAQRPSRTCNESKEEARGTAAGSRACHLPAAEPATYHSPACHLPQSNTSSCVGRVSDGEEKSSLQCLCCSWPPPRKSRRIFNPNARPCGETSFLVASTRMRN